VHGTSSTALPRSLATLALIILAACGRAPATPAITLTQGSSPAVEVSGLPATTVDALERSALTDDQWSNVFRVAVGKDAPPMLGSYTIDSGVVRFTPAFPFDPGRQYEVTFNASSVAGAAGPASLSASVGRPGEHRVPSTMVTRIYPSGDVIPANVLRMYIEFSAPMGRKSGVEHITLLNQKGEVVEGAVLPLDYEFWSPDHKRFTVFFDPGRVKQGILPNRQMGRAFAAGQTATLVISREWLDEHGQPLKEEYRRQFRAAAADEAPLDPAQWRIAAPAASGRDPVVVTFPEALDHGIMMRALGIRRDGEVVTGEIAISNGETRWAFTPNAPWRAGTYHLLALDVLEDVSGNQIGKAFEVDNFDTVDKSPNPQSLTLPFVVR
jgi:hypothetical protein